ncbi:MAG: hypothetical protein AAGJ46_05495 [Planctomycetota bacterium]
MTAEQLAAQLNSGSDEDRRAAAQLLAGMGEDATLAAAALAHNAADPAVGEWCVAALEELGPPPADQADRLGELLKNRAEQTAYWAATLLGRLGPVAAGHATGLAAAATDHGSLAVRERAVWAIGKIGPDAKAVAPAIAPLVEAGEPRLARWAKQALAALGE